MSESKTESTSTPATPLAPENNSLMGVFLGLFWLLWGNILLVAMAIKIIQQPRFLTTYDLFYWVFVVLLAVTRFCDIRYFRKFTLKGSQATMAHWRKYIIYLLLISVGLWILVHALSLLK